MDARERVARELESQNLDAIIVASPENVFYLAGIRIPSQRLIPDRASFVVMSADGKTTLLTAAATAAFARRDSRVDTVASYGRHESPAEVLCQVLTEGGLKTAKIGLDSRFISIGDFWTFSGLLTKARFVSGHEVMKLARMVKTSREIELLRHAEYLTELAVVAAFAMTREGDTELEIAKKIGMNFLSHGAETVDFVFLTAAENSTIFHLPPSAYRVAKGDVIHLDCGASFDNYRSDLSRNIGIGSLRQKQIDTYARLWDVQRGIIDRIRPGVAVGQLVDDYLKLMDGVGLVPPSPNLGHSIGLSLHEFPELLPDETTVLVPGMVLAIEPNTVIQGDARYDIEDTVVVTESHCEMMSGDLNPREVWVIGGNGQARLGS